MKIFPISRGWLIWSMILIIDHCDTDIPVWIYIKNIYLAKKHHKIVFFSCISRTNVRFWVTIQQNVKLALNCSEAVASYLELQLYLVVSLQLFCNNQCSRGEHFLVQIQFMVAFDEQNVTSTRLALVQMTPSALTFLSFKNVL